MDEHRHSVRVSIAVGERVRTKRLEDGLSEDAVARALNCEVEDFRAAESGEVNFTAEDIVGLCSILCVSPSWFFQDLIR